MPTPGSRRSGTCASMAIHSAAALHFAAIRCGGSRSSSCTSSRSSSTCIARSRRSTRWSSASGRSPSPMWPAGWPGSSRTPRPSAKSATPARGGADRARSISPGWTCARVCLRWPHSPHTCDGHGPRARAPRSQRSCIGRSGDRRPATGGAESYIGPVLRAIEARVAPAGVRYVGVGPRHNFRARRWWHPLLASERLGDRPDRAVRAGRRARGVAGGLPPASRGPDRALGQRRPARARAHSGLRLLAARARAARRNRAAAVSVVGACDGRSGRRSRPRSSRESR